MRRLKKILKRLALALGLLIAVALIANAILVWQTGKRLEERLSKLRAAGEPLSLPEQGAMPVLPGADAAAVLKRIEPELKALNKEMNPVFLATSNIRNVTDEGWKAIETALANHPTVVTGLQEAAACPSYRWPVDFQVTPAPRFHEELQSHIQIQRQVVNILEYQALLQLRRKDRDGAMRTCLTSLRISRLAEQGPMMISYLVALATSQIGVRLADEILRAGPLAADLHRELEAELAKHDDTDGFRRCLRTERAFGLQQLDDMNVGWFLRFYNNDQKCHYLDVIGESIAQAGGSFAQFQDYERSTKGESDGFRHLLSRILTPAIVKVWEANFRVRCMVRCLRVVNALVEKKLDAAPANLADLGLPPDAVTDPYTDKPLIVKRQDGQWVVYGLGTNLKDDGGDLDLLKDVGLGPVKPKK